MAPVPRKDVPVDEQIKAALKKAGVSQRELARRLQSSDASWESKRRWLPKVLSGEIKRPEQSSLDAVAVALDLPPGTFRRPSVESVKVRRQSLEDEVSDLHGAVVALLRVAEVLSQEAAARGAPLPADAREELARAVLRMQGVGP